MINYFIRFCFFDHSILFMCNDIEISDRFIYFKLNDVYISAIEITDIKYIYHFVNDYNNRIYDFENVPFPEVMKNG